MELKIKLFVGILFAFAVSLQMKSEEDIIFSDELRWHCITLHFEGCLSDCTEAEMVFRTALYYEEQGDYEKAIEHLNITLGLEIEEWMITAIHLKFHQIYNRLGNFAKAEEYFNKTREGERDEFDAELDILNLFSIMLSINELIVVQQNYELAAEKLSNFLEFILVKDFSYGFSAAEFFEVIASLYFTLGVMYADKQNYEKAIKYTQKAIDLEQDDTMYYETLNILKLLQTGIIPEGKRAEVEKFKESLKEFKESLMQ